MAGTPSFRRPVCSPSEAMWGSWLPSASTRSTAATASWANCPYVRVATGGRFHHPRPSCWRILRLLSQRRHATRQASWYSVYAIRENRAAQRSPRSPGSVSRWECRSMIAVEASGCGPSRSIDADVSLQGTEVDRKRSAQKCICLLLGLPFRTYDPRRGGGV